MSNSKSALEPPPLTSQIVAVPVKAIELVPALTVPIVPLYILSEPSSLRNAINALLFCVS